MSSIPLQRIQDPDRDLRNADALRNAIQGVTEIAAGVPLSDGSGGFTALTYVPWTDWTPTWYGFSANPTVTCRYTQTGKLVFCQMDSGGYGTSNAAVFLFTLPAAPSATAHLVRIGTYVDNGTIGGVGGRLVIDDVQGAYNNCAQVYYTDAAAGWTTSGTKGILGSITFFYEAA